MTSKLICLLVTMLLMTVKGLSIDERCYAEDEEASHGDTGYVFKTGIAQRDNSWKNPNLPFWSQLRNSGSKDLPTYALRTVRSYSMNFFKFNDKNEIIDRLTNEVLKGNLIFNFFFIILIFTFS